MKSYLHVCLTTLLIAGAAVATPNAQAEATSTDAFTPAQQEAIGQIAVTYLAQHPEYLVAAQETLRQEQIIAQRQKIALTVPTAAEKLLHDKNSPAVGPIDAKVAVVIFTDYQSSDSQNLEPVVAKLIQHHPQIRVINKEFPILAGRWPVSGEAAMAAQQAWVEQGATGYYSLRKAIYASNHVDGTMDMQDIAVAMKKVGLKPLNNKEKIKAERDAVNANLKLGQDLGMTITPTIIVMPQSGVTANNLTVFTSLPTEEQLSRAVALSSQSLDK